MIFDALVVGGIRSGAFRALVTLLAVALGVAVAVAIGLADSAVIRSAAHDAQLLAAPADLQIVGSGRGLDERVLARVINVAGITSARPIVAGNALIVARARARAAGRESVGIIGVDMLHPLPGVGNVDQREPGAFTPNGSPLLPQVTLDERGAVVSARLARRFGLHAGTRFETLVGAQYVTLHVAAVLPQGATGVDSSVVFVDVGTAQMLFDQAGLLDRIDLSIDRPAAAVRARLSAALPPGARVESPSGNGDAVGRLLREFILDFGVLGDLALLLAATLVYGAVGTSVMQRRADIGTLRGLGATRAQVFGAFLAEGALFGALGSLLGIVLGSFCARYVLAALAPQAPASYGVAISDLIELARALGAGVGIATLAAVLPALAAMRVAPAQAMGARGFEGPRRGPRLGPSVRGWPAWAFLASANVAAAPKRTGVAIAALTVAVGATVGFATANASLRSALGAWVQQSLAGDLIVRPQTRALFDARTIRRMSHVAGVARVDGSRTLPVTFRDGTITLRGDDRLDAATSISSPSFSAGHFASARDANASGLGLARQWTGVGSVPRSGDAIASASLARRYGLHVGERIELSTPAGPVTVRIAVIRDDFAGAGGTLEVARALLTRYYGASRADTLTVFTNANSAPSDVRTRLVQALAPMALRIATTRELRAQALGIFDRTFTIATSLAAISLLIAVCAIATTLAALVLERRREIGLLRYAGATRATIRAMVLGEGALIGVCGSIAGLCFGFVVVIVQLGMIDGRIFGQSIAVHVPGDVIAGTLVATLLAAVLAALPPARLAARIATDAARTPA
ncbi:MAG: FtsX-like permease family protein [Candidatus Eremiobacteraeota bacterium]|nr:FtsX-like permease family protein [Candidatus Eremiobacteraeota bacterium]